jgi:cardiolipin synthase
MSVLSGAERPAGRVWLPNLLTASRLALTPFIVDAILGAHHGRALLLLVVAGVSDGADGLLARRLAVTSRVGAYLDPVADKVLMSAVFIAMAMSGIAPWWYVAIVFGRDFLILGFAALTMGLSKRRDFRPSFWGKASTALQVLTAVALLGAPERIGRAVLWTSALMTLWSGLHYANAQFIRSRRRAIDLTIGRE